MMVKCENSEPFYFQSEKNIFDTFLNDDPNKDTIFVDSGDEDQGKECISFANRLICCPINSLLKEYVARKEINLQSVQADLLFQDSLEDDKRREQFRFSETRKFIYQSFDSEISETCKDAIQLSKASPEIIVKLAQCFIKYQKIHVDIFALQVMDQISSTAHVFFTLRLFTYYWNKLSLEKSHLIRTISVCLIRFCKRIRAYLPCCKNNCNIGSGQSQGSIDSALPIRDDFYSRLDEAILERYCFIQTCDDPNNIFTPDFQNVHEKILEAMEKISSEWDDISHHPNFRCHFQQGIKSVRKSLGILSCDELSDCIFCIKELIYFMCGSNDINDGKMRSAFQHDKIILLFSHAYGRQFGVDNIVTNLEPNSRILYQNYVSKRLKILQKFNEDFSWVNQVLICLLPLLIVNAITIDEPAFRYFYNQFRSYVEENHCGLMEINSKPPEVYNMNLHFLINILKDIQCHTFRIECIFGNAFDFQDESKYYIRKQRLIELSTLFKEEILNIGHSRIYVILIILLYAWSNMKSTGPVIEMNTKSWNIHCQNESKEYLQTLHNLMLTNIGKNRKDKDKILEEIAYKNVKDKLDRISKICHTRASPNRFLSPRHCSGNSLVEDERIVSVKNYKDIRYLMNLVFLYKELIRAEVFTQCSLPMKFLRNKISIMLNDVLDTSNTQNDSILSNKEAFEKYDHIISSLIKKEDASGSIKDILQILPVMENLLEYWEDTIYILGSQKAPTYKKYSIDKLKVLLALTEKLEKVMKKEETYNLLKKGFKLAKEELLNVIKTKSKDFIEIPSYEYFTSDNCLTGEHDYTQRDADTIKTKQTGNAKPTIRNSNTTNRKKLKNELNKSASPCLSCSGHLEPLTRCKRHRIRHSTSNSKSSNGKNFEDTKICCTQFNNNCSYSSLL